MRALQCYVERTGGVQTIGSAFRVLWCTCKRQTSIKTEPLPLDSRGYRVFLSELVFRSPGEVACALYAGGLVCLGLTKGCLSGRYLQSCKLEFSPHFHEILYVRCGCT